MCFRVSGHGIGNCGSGGETSGNSGFPPGAFPVLQSFDEAWVGFDACPLTFEEIVSVIVRHAFVPDQVGNDHGGAARYTLSRFQNQIYGERERERQRVAITCWQWTRTLCPFLRILSMWLQTASKWGRRSAEEWSTISMR